jgi:hypothetical protein
VLRTNYGITQRKRKRYGEGEGEGEGEGGQERKALEILLLKRYDSIPHVMILQRDFWSKVS